MSEEIKKIDEKLLTICNMIDENVASINSGNLVDMTEVEESVKELCASISELSVDQAKEYLPKLSVLMEHFQEISGKLQSQKELVESDIERLGGSGDAVSAYNNASKLSE